MSEEERLPINIVVGAGPSGLFLCAELAKYSHVILVEQGPSLLADVSPLHWGHTALHDPNTLRHVSEPSSALGGRQLLLPIGQGIGGSSRINAMIFSAGHASVFVKYWPVVWADKLPRLLKDVRTTIKPTKYTASGLMQTALHVGVMEASSANAPMLRADLWNSSEWDQHGIIDTYHTLASNNERCNLGDLLLPHVASGRVSIVHGSALRVLEDDEGCAHAVDVQHTNGHREIVTTANGGEIVLCAGAFGTPQLLHASSLPSLKPLSSKIGANLIDHTLLPIMALGYWWAQHNSLHNTLLDMMRASSVSLAAATNQQCICCVPGFGACNLSQIWSVFISVMTSILNVLFGAKKSTSSRSSSPFPPNGVHGWVYLNADGSLCCDEDTIPKFQLLLVDGRISGDMLAESLFPRLQRPHVYRRCLRPILVRTVEWLVHLSLVQWFLSFTFGFLICNVQPSASVGSIKSDAATSSLKIVMPEPSEADITATAAALDTARSILHNVRSKGLWCVELLPGPLFLYTATDTLFRYYYSAFTTSYFHYCGTCRMETTVDKGGVVDESLRVKGIKSLRIADASVIPRMPTSPLSALCMCIGKAAGELLQETHVAQHRDSNSVGGDTSVVSQDSDYFDEFDEACVLSDDEEYVVEA